MEAVGLYTYQGASDGELSFDEGDVLKILSEKDSEWYLAEFYGEEGYIPISYVQFDKPLWYRNITKAEAAAILSEKSGKSYRQPTGAFLVRPSESGSGDISLTVRLTAVEHFKIVKEKGNYFIWRAEPHFSSIDKLIKHYRQKSISKSEQVRLKDLVMKTVTVEYDYKAQSAEEIDIYAGEKITVFSDSDPDWWVGQLERDGTSVRGSFPANYISH